MALHPTPMWGAIFARAPVYVLPYAMAGVSAPIDLFGSIIQKSAEAVAGMTLVQSIKPGSPAVYCIASTTADMRTALCVYSPPELFLINAICLQMAIDYNHVRPYHGWNDRCGDVFECDPGGWSRR